MNKEQERKTMDIIRGIFDHLPVYRRLIVPAVLGAGSISLGLNEIDQLSSEIGLILKVILAFISACFFYLSAINIQYVEYYRNPKNTNFNDLLTKRNAFIPLLISILVLIVMNFMYLTEGRIFVTLNMMLFLLFTAFFFKGLQSYKRRLELRLIINYWIEVEEKEK
ncbi:hypothetical protein ACQKMD_07470 [Viridibacillus sp. NPDC096237]|uniref:hypothetical protein n=1 Tax=Viridibacillus sp. NPDC096237 TaxID=3390721 RepID=UPI003CFF352D